MRQKSEPVSIFRIAKASLVDDKSSEPHWVLMQDGNPTECKDYTVVTAQPGQFIGRIRYGYTWNGSEWLRPCGRPARCPVFAWLDDTRKEGQQHGNP